jgi:uncharacterized membrane protein
MADDRSVVLSQSRLVSVLKAVSWRMTAGIDTFVVAWFITGSVKGAGAIVGIEAMTKIGLYYGHERVWVKLTQRRAWPRILQLGQMAPPAATEIRDAA